MAFATAIAAGIAAAVGLPFSVSCQAEYGPKQHKNYRGGSISASSKSKLSMSYPANSTSTQHS